MKKATVSILLSMIFVTCATSGAFAADPTINMRLAMGIPSKLPIIQIVTDYAQNVELMSNGSIRMKIFEPGELVSPSEIHEAVSKGRIEAGWGTSAYISGKIPAAALFLATPFGGTAKELMAWNYYGNGLKLWQEMYDAKGFNVKVIP